jgi:nitrite reductase/ring-hydroxylating ferredoxin subunit
MDVPHLQYVHKQVDAWQTFLTDTVSGAVFLQKIPFFRLPLTVLIYKATPDSITYYTSFGFYLLIVETTWAEVAHNRTRVTTTYAVGWVGWLLGMGYPLIRWLLTRNYRILMSEDLPMREQRGLLRSKGYEFRFPEGGPSHLYSKKIMEQNVVVPEQNVIAPPAVPRWDDVTIRLSDIQDGGVATLGEANHVGLSVVRTGDALQFFPRLCPHEGADLDAVVRLCGSASRGATSACVIQCPWHGRKFSPILTLRLPMEKANYETEWHAFAAANDSVRVSCKPADDDRLRHSDWSRAAYRV